MPQMLRAFAHLFTRIFVSWIIFLGTSPYGIIAQVSSLVLYQATGVTGNWWRMETWEQVWSSKGLKRGLKVISWVWAFAFLVCTVTTVYDDHVKLTTSSISLRSENGQLRDSNRKLVSKTDDWESKYRDLEEKYNSCLRRTTPSGTPFVATTISSGMVEVRMVCSLRDPTKLPEDLALSVPANPLASYLEGAIGKSYLRAQGEVSFKRMEEEGKAQVIQKYDLPPNSNLLGVPASQLRNYEKIYINPYEANGDHFSSCDSYEVTLRINGIDVFHNGQRIPDTFDHTLRPGHSLTLVLRLVGLKVPQ